MQLVPARPLAAISFSRRTCSPLLLIFWWRHLAGEVLVKRAIPVSVLSILFLAAAFLCVAQEKSTQADKVSAKTIRISGTVGSLGKLLVSDKGNRIWRVINPEVLGGVEGRRVAAKARVNPDADEITIVVVRLLEVRTTAKLDDAAFRR